jgi:hypothetical protein
MSKEFYTERDIEDLLKKGTTFLELSDDIVLTELAFEKAQRLGLKLITKNAKPPSAPERPYLAKISSPTATVNPISVSPSPAVSASPDVRQKIKDAVIAKLDTQVDPNLLDSIITRVLDALGRK